MDLSSLFPFLPKVYNTVQLDTFTVIQSFCWLAAAVTSFYFSFGNARLWTSISVGFFLVFWGQIYQLNPYALTYFKVSAFHYLLGTVAILVISHGFQEYFIFTRTLEITGSKRAVYLWVIGMLVIAGIIIAINPKPSVYTLRNFKFLNHAVWFFFSCINLFTIYKIYQEMKDSPIANGILSFALVFVFIIIWKGSSLYLDIYQWDKDWMDIIEFTGETSDAEAHAGIITIAQQLNSIGVLMSGISVAGTFGYLFKLLR
jgi:hypothetical protein